MYLYKKKGISLFLSLSMLFTGCNIAYADEIGINTEVIQNQDDSAVDEIRWDKNSTDTEVIQNQDDNAVDETRQDKNGTDAEVIQNQDDSVMDEMKQEEIEYQIEIEQKEITLEIGETQELKYKILAYGEEIEIPEDEIKWISDDEEVALINKGVITAVTEGTTQITAFLREEPTAAPEYE